MKEFIEKFLPGPVTVIVPARKTIPGILTGGTGMIGIRIPAHGVAIQIIERFDAPITATSANLMEEKMPARKSALYPRSLHRRRKALR